MLTAIENITDRLGGLETKNAIAALEVNDIPACFDILLKYYDRAYTKALHKREGLEQLMTTFTATDVVPDNAILLEKLINYGNNGDN